MVRLKMWYHSKTMWVAILTAIVGVLSTIAGSDFIANNPTAVSVFVMVIGILNAVLRSITDTPITLSSPEV